MVLLGGAALLFCASLLPWYRIEGRGFVFQFSGWHDLGVLAWILTIDLLAWELLRLSPYAPVTGDRGDRFSAFGGLCVAGVAGIFVLQRLAEGGIGTGWYAGVVLVAALGAASVRLFSDARGPQAVAAALGRAEPPVDDELDGDGGPPPQAGAGPAAGRRLPAPSVPLGLTDDGDGRRPPAAGAPGPTWSRPSRPTPDRGAPGPGTSRAGGPDRRAASSRPAGAGDGGLWSNDRSAPAPRPRRADAPVRRPHPEDAEQVAPGRWRKTLAERQRDQPPLWADRDADGPPPSPGRGGPGRSS